MAKTRNATKRAAKKLAKQLNGGGKHRIVEAGKNTQFGKNGKIGGRKPLSVELKARERILEVIGGSTAFDKLVKKIYQQATAGSFRHQELLLNYILGKPTDKLKIESASGADLNVGAPIIKIIADNMRLERLNKDIAEKDNSTPEERIKEAEQLLNNELEHQT